MLQILRLARRDGNEWVRLFASVLAPFPTNQTISVDQITEGGLEGLQEEVAEACMCMYVHKVEIKASLYQESIEQPSQGEACNSHRP